MKETWSLDVLYKGYDDPQFEADIKKLDELIAQCNTLADTLSPVSYTHLTLPTICSV